MASIHVYIPLNPQFPDAIPIASIAPTNTYVYTVDTHTVHYAWQGLQVN